MRTELASRYRHLFPVLDNVTYLNSCSQGALAIPVRDAINQYLDGMYAQGSLWDQWVMKLEELRDLVALAFTTNKSNVAITTTVSAGINSVLSSFDFSGKKNQIITTNMEFPTMGQILHAQERRGAEIIHIGSNKDGLLDFEKFEENLNENVALVAVTHVCYKNGAMTDVKAITDIAHRHNIPVLVDAYQSVGSVPIHFDDLGADFLVGGFLKYMLGIPGIGFLLAKENSEWIPTKTGWFAARNVFTMNIESYEPALDARRFEEGTPPIPSIYAAIAGLKILLDVGISNIWQEVSLSHNILRNRIEDLGLHVVTPSKNGAHGAMIAFASTNDTQVVSSLQNSRVICSSRGGNVRISPHFYNDQKDLETLISALSRLL